jgi:predicted permease
VYFAARSQFSAGSAVRSVFSLPAIYAAILALLLRALGLHMPQEVASGVSMVAGAYSPVVLAILGVQMVRVQTAQAARNVQLAFWTGMSVRLVLAPLTAALLLFLLNISGTLFAVQLILASMPVAVNSVVLAERFGSSPALVSRYILWTTLASFLMLPLLISIVGSV